MGSQLGIGRIGRVGTSRQEHADLCRELHPQPRLIGQIAELPQRWCPDGRELGEVQEARGDVGPTLRRRGVVVRRQPARRSLGTFWTFWTFRTSETYRTLWTLGTFRSGDSLDTLRTGGAIFTGRALRTFRTC